jgi:heme o synthase
MHVPARTAEVQPLPHLVRQYWALTKPRVTQLALFCAVIGMFLATPELPPLRVVLVATLGIWLLAGAAFAVNSIIERQIDAVMARTRMRPMARGEITPLQALVFSGLVGGAGMWVLYTLVNPLTMWLTFATFVGYAIVYTVLLKPNTPQNIVIGGLSGAMPPVLGWAAITNDVPAQAWLLALIIFVWTPPHFWALALYRVDDYRKSGLPMLPVTHGAEFTRLHIFLYTLILVGTSVLPFAIRMSGLLYLLCALALGGVFLVYSWRLYRAYSDRLARATFSYSIVYLAALFAALLVDHYL